MNEFIFQVAVVFVPGLIWLAIVDRLTTGLGKRSPLETALRGFAFGITAYFISFVLFALYVRGVWGAWPSLPKGMTGPLGARYLDALGPKDVIRAALLAPFLAISWSFAANRKYFLRFMQRVRITRKFGDESVWDFTMNMGTPAVEYVNIRDFDKRIVYAGFVMAFSEGKGNREILLDEAIVYDLASARELLRVPLLYLSLKPDALHVEYPFTKPTPEPKREE
jgi:hypothetical protein